MSARSGTAPRARPCDSDAHIVTPKTFPFINNLRTPHDLIYCNQRSASAVRLNQIGGVEKLNDRPSKTQADQKRKACPSMSGKSATVSVAMAASWRELFSSDRWLRRFVGLVVVDLLALGGGFALDADFGTASTFLPFAVLEIAGIFLALWLALAPSAYLSRRSIAALSIGTPASVWKLWRYGPNIRTLSSIERDQCCEGTNCNADDEQDDPEYSAPG
jgi:hypothetical protein